MPNITTIRDLKNEIDRRSRLPGGERYGPGQLRIGSEVAVWRKPGEGWSAGTITSTDNGSSVFGVLTGRGEEKINWAKICPNDSCGIKITQRDQHDARGLLEEDGSASSSGSGSSDNRSPRTRNWRGILTVTPERRHQLRRTQLAARSILKKYLIKRKVS